LPWAVDAALRGGKFQLKALTWKYQVEDSDGIARKTIEVA
jgi:hypothetical protein